MSSRSQRDGGRRKRVVWDRFFDNWTLKGCVICVVAYHHRIAVLLYNIAIDMCACMRSLNVAY